MNYSIVQKIESLAKKKIKKNSLLWKLLRYCKQIIKRIFYFGNELYCPCCHGHFRKMKPFEAYFYISGTPVNQYTKNAICPICLTDVRHRFIITFLKKYTNILTARLRMLHFAPEYGVSPFFRKMKNIDYVSCDINPSNYPGSIKVDISHIQFPDNSFDCILASHVLEHIEDDEQAIREIYRVIKPGGWALVAIPIYGEKTVEDPSLDFNGREKMYGDGTHVRMNGVDFKFKLSAAGFDVKMISLEDVPGNYFDRSVSSPHLDTDKYLFFCNKLK